MQIKTKNIIVTSFCDMLLEYPPGLQIFLRNEDREVLRN